MGSTKNHTRFIFGAFYLNGLKTKVVLYTNPRVPQTALFLLIDFYK